MENTNTSIVLAPMKNVAAGKGFKQVQNFGQGSAKEIKEALKAANPDLKGRALSRKVNEVLSGEKDLRAQLGVAFVQATIQSGFVPDVGIVGKNTASLKFVRVKEVAEKAEEDYENLSTDEIAALLHKLEAILDAKVLASEG